MDTLTQDTRRVECMGPFSWREEETTVSSP